MTDRKLTIGMATYDDFNGVYFSIMSIKIYHKEVYDQLEFVVIDNNPSGKEGQAVKKFLQNEVKKNYKYVPYTEKVSSFSKYKVYDHAETPYVLIMDSHVFLDPNVLKRLLNYYRNHPNTMNLLQGPMMLCDNISTNMTPTKWGSGMWGTWVNDPRGRDKNAKAFEIEMQGMALLSSRKAAWPGINPLFKGFGGEEGYIQGKFKKNGAKTLCLPFMRWYHRFGRPGGVPFSLKWEDRVWNYLVAFTELGYDVKPIYEHFKWMKKEKIDKMYEEVKKKMSK